MFSLQIKGQSWKHERMYMPWRTEGGGLIGLLEARNVFSNMLAENF